MGNTKNVTEVLFWFIILSLLSFGFAKYFLYSDIPTLISKADAEIAKNQQQTSSPEGRIRLAVAYFEKYHENGEKSNLNNGIQLLKDINPGEFPIKNYLLGIFYLENQEEELALKYLGNFIQNEPNHQEALLAKGTALIRLGKYQEAINTLTTLANQRPEIADTYELMSEAYLNLGDKKMAKKVGHKAEELLGGDPDCIPGTSEENAENEYKPKD